MSYSLDLFFTGTGSQDIGSRLRDELGVRVYVTSTANNPSWEIQLSNTRFWISPNQVDLINLGLGSEDYVWRLEGVIPCESEIDAFCLTYALLIKMFHVDLVVERSLLVFSCQSQLAFLQSKEQFLVDLETLDQISYAELPLFVRKEIVEKEIL